MAHSQTPRAEPRAGRPYMPEGYGVPQNDAGLMPWSKARAALEQARLLMISAQTCANSYRWLRAEREG